MAKKKEEPQAPITEDVLAPEVESEIAEDPEMNAGLLVSVRDVFAQREEARKGREEQKKQREEGRAVSPTGTRITRQKIMADTPYGARMLHTFDKGVELLIHAWKGDEPVHEICQVHYGEKCTICGTVGTQYGESYAIPSKCFLSYVYNNVGATFDKVVAGATKTFQISPIKVLEIPLGKDDVNVIGMQEASRANKLRPEYFSKAIWLIERKKGKGFSVPRTIEDEEFKALVGGEVSLDLTENAEKIASMSKQEIMKIILSSFNNVQWEKLGFKPPQSEVLVAKDDKSSTSKSSRTEF